MRQLPAVKDGVISAHRFFCPRLAVTSAWHEHNLTRWCGASGSGSSSSPRRVLSTWRWEVRHPAFTRRLHLSVETTSWWSLNSSRCRAQNRKDVHLHYIYSWRSYKALGGTRGGFWGTTPGEYYSIPLNDLLFIRLSKEIMLLLCLMVALSVRRILKKLNLNQERRSWIRGRIHTKDNLARGAFWLFFFPKQ